MPNASPTVQPTDILKFRYIVAYQVDGLQSPPTGPILLYSNEAEGKKISLTGLSHENWNHIDTVLTIANITLTSLLQGKTWDLNEFASFVSSTTEDRVRRFGSAGAFLMVEASHEEEAARIGEIGYSDQRDYCLALPNGFRDEVETRHKTFLERSQSFLSFAMPSVCGFLPAGSCIVANHPSGKPLYVMTFSMNARPSILKPIPADGPELFATLFQHSVELEYFQTAFRLTAGSALNSRDDLRAFLFASIALEVFVSKLSSQFAKQLDGLKEKDHSTKIHAHLNRLRKDGKEHVLSYKFARVSSYLALDNLDEIIDEFDRSNKCRNDIVHGGDFDEARLPTTKVREWLGELVRLYITHQDQPA